jgi:hypothetical protein
MNHLYWNIPADWIFCTGIFLLNEYFVLAYSCWMNDLYWNIPTEWIIYTGIFLLAEWFVLEYSCWLNILYWNIPAEWIFCTGIFLLNERLVPSSGFATSALSLSCDVGNVRDVNHFPGDIVLSDFFYWNIPTDCIFCTGIPLLTAYFVLGIFCTGISLSTEYFVLEYPYWRNILYWIILTVCIFCTGISLVSFSKFNSQTRILVCIAILPWGESTMGIRRDIVQNEFSQKCKHSETEFSQKIAAQ